MASITLIRKQLETRLGELMERCPAIEAILSDPGESDWEENAVAMEGDEALAAIGDLTKQEIRDIRLALNRIDRGTYGVCVRCGHPVGQDRLAAIPWVATCIRCG